MIMEFLQGNNRKSLENKPRVIALYSEKSGTGKTSVANYLQRVYGFYRMSFAEEVREMVYYVLSKKSDWIDTPANREMLMQNKDSPPTINCKLTFRQMVIEVGMFMREKFGNDYWIQALHTNLLQNRSAFGFTSPVVIDDLRFENEYKFLKDNYNTLFLRLTASKRGVNLVSHQADGKLNHHRFNYTLDTDNQENGRRVSELLLNIIDITYPEYKRKGKGLIV